MCIRDSSYATKQNRRKLLKAYSDKEPLAKLLFLPEDTELAIRTSAGPVSYTHLFLLRGSTAHL